MQAGFNAIGTTSLATAFGAGVEDGTGQTRDQTIDLARQLGRLKALVTVDIESGFSERDDEVAAVVRELAEAGIVGCNIEDGTSTGKLVPADRQIEKIRACREADADIFINARIDTYWVGSAEGDAAANEVLERARRYVDAGADGIFIPALADAAQIRAYCKEIPAPVNVLYSPAGLTVAELNDAGAARLSTGSFLFRHAISGAVEAVREIVGGALPGAEVPAYGEFLG
ncbi:isocitrate lyase/phosphoenolpyruvate mutase family protein [Spelaeicoccus albus]